MTKTWKIGVLLAAIPTLAWGFQSPHAEPISPDATEAESPFDGHYERIGTGADAGAKKASFDILQVGPGVLRIKGSAGPNGSTGNISGTLKPERLKAHFENAAGCKLDILFQAEGLKIQNVSTACGGPFEGEYKRTGPPTIGRNPGGH